ncbi:MAG: peptidase domain-containing ABC transporter [Treponema sp.]|nr:peptidase domain-containing ABC transporter [Treponema sp.]
MKKYKPILIKQQDETDCGAACLATIAKYYGKITSITKIRNYAGTDSIGTSAKGMVKAAKALNFTCKAFGSKRKLIKSLSVFPLIAHLNKNGNRHYVIIYKIKNDKLLIADPADSIKWIKSKTFLKWWTGIFIILYPSKEFKKSNDNKSFFTRFFHLVSDNKTVAFQTFAASFLLTILGILGAFYFRYLIDNVIYSYLPSALISVSIAYLIVIIFQSLLGFARNSLIIFLGNKMEASLTLEYVKHVFHLPLDFFTKRKSGEILSRLNDINTIKNALSSMTVGIILDCIMLIFDGIILFTFSFSLITIAIIPVLLSTLLVFLFTKKFKTLIYHKSVIEAEKYSHLVESINGISTIKALSTEDDTYDKAELKIIESIESTFKLLHLGNFQNTLETFFTLAGNLAVYWFGSYLIMQGKLSLGELIAFVTLLGYFLGPLSRLITLQPQLLEISVASNRLGEIHDLPEENTINHGKMIPQNIEGNICIRNLYFSYGTRGITLNNMSLDIKKGERVAFVGPSGSGKTTLIKLILKFYNEDSGTITLDGKNIKDFDTTEYRKLFGYVPQEILLFSGTIEENITWGNDDATAEEIFKAASDAEALDFISKLDKRFASKIGEKGASLSGGERQRIALARVLLRNPKILILDEATSNLDSLSEAKILKTIEKISKNKTTIIIAHHLSTIKNCDKIFVLQDGYLIESGTHVSLMQNNGIYKKMWQSQNQDN